MATNSNAYGPGSAEQDRINALTGVNDPAQIANNILTQNKLASDNLAAKTASDNQAMLDKQSGQVGDYINSYKAAVPGIVSGAYNQFGIAPLTSQANALESRISMLSNNPNAAGTGGNVGMDAINNKINTFYNPRFTATESALSRGANAAQAQINANLQPFQEQGTQLTNQLNNETSVMTGEQKNQLDSLLAQMQAGVTLTGYQMDQVSKLAQIESNEKIAAEGNQNNIDVAKLNPASRYVNLGSSLYDTQTGQFLKAPSTSSGGPLPIPTSPTPTPTNNNTGTQKSLDQIAKESTTNGGVPTVPVNSDIQLNNIGGLDLSKVLNQGAPH